MATSKLTAIEAKQSGSKLGGFVSLDIGSNLTGELSAGVLTLDADGGGAGFTQYDQANGAYNGWSAWNGGAVSWTGSRMRITSSGSVSGVSLSRSTGHQFEQGKSYVILIEDINTTSSDWWIQDYWGTVESKPNSFRMNLPSGSDTNRGWGAFQFDCKTDTGAVVIYCRTGGQTFDFASFRVYEVAPNNQGNLFVSLGQQSYASFEGVAIGHEAAGSNNGVTIGAKASTIHDDTYDVGGSTGPAVAIGYGAEGMLWRAVAMGEYAMAAAVSATAVGANAYCSLRHGVALGRGAICPESDAWIDLSAHPMPPGFSLGGSIGSGGEANVYFSNGWAALTDLAPNGIAQVSNTDPGGTVTRLHGQSGWDGKATPTTTDKPGGPIYVCGGQSTGTADGGVAGFQITVAGGASGNTVNALTTAIQANPATTGETYLEAYNKAADQLQELGTAIFSNASEFTLFDDNTAFSSSSQVSTQFWFQENSQLTKPTRATKVKVYNAPAGSASIVYGNIDDNGNLDVIGTQPVTFDGGDQVIDLETSGLTTDNVFVGFQESGSARIRYESEPGYTNSVWYATSDGSAVSWADDLRLGYELIRPVADQEALNHLATVAGGLQPNGFNLEKALNENLAVTLPPGVTPLAEGFTLPAGAVIKGHSLGSVLQLTGTTTGLRINSGDATISDLTIRGELAAFDPSAGFTSDADVEAITISGTVGTDYAVLIDSSIGNSANVLIENVVFENVQGVALHSNSTTDRKGPRLKGITCSACEVGIYYGTLAEYTLATDITCYSCWYGVVQYAGNVHTSNVNVTECRVGLFLGGDGLNDSHSGVSGGLVNHQHLYSIYAEAFTLGWLVSNLNVWEGDVRAVGCAGLSIDHCTIAAEIQHDDAVSLFVTNSRFYNSYGGGTFTETGSASTVVTHNNYYISDGTAV